MKKTNEQYQSIIEQCRIIFTDKTKDYGTAWRVLRSSSLTDQIYIKAQRIRTLQETEKNEIGDDTEGEFRAIVNYCIMGLIQIEEQLKEIELPLKEALLLYNKYANNAFELMEKKNHDYGEAWREMRVSSLTDLILMKLLRIKQIENNGGKTIVSEGISANYYDILNYSIFALIHLQNEL